MKRLAMTLIAVFLLIGSANAAPITVDGNLGDWDSGMLLTTKTGANEQVNVFAYADTDTLYLGFAHSGGNAGNDYRGATVTGADNVLDVNIGLVGGAQTLPWRWALRTKANQTVNESFDMIDGFYGSWEDTANPNIANMDTNYYNIPTGVSMFTDFSSGIRVTEMAFDMSLLFDGTYGWDTAAGSTLMLGGLALSTANAWSAGDALFWPDGINHGDAGTYATITVQNAVPVPAAVWLLGSGLLGLIGFRRKTAK